MERLAAKQHGGGGATLGERAAEVVLVPIQELK